MSRRRLHWSREAAGSASAITSRGAGGTGYAWRFTITPPRRSGQTVETFARGGTRTIAGRTPNESAPWRSCSARSTSSAGSTCSSTAPPLAIGATGAVTAAELAPQLRRERARHVSLRPSSRAWQWCVNPRRCIINFGDWAETRPYVNYARISPARGLSPLDPQPGRRTRHAQSKVRVNCILPGPVLFQPDLPAAEQQQAIQATLAQRAARPRTSPRRCCTDRQRLRDGDS